MNTYLRRAARDYGLPAALFAAVWVGMLASRSGIGDASIFPVLDSFALLGLLALGIGVTMIAGELDLSIASMAALMGIVAVKAQGAGLYGALVIATAAGTALGATQGYAIARLQINSVVFTIGTLILFRGVALLFGDQVIPLNNPFMGLPLLNRTGVLSTSIGIALGVFAVVGVALAFLKSGREIYAVGGDRLDAAAAGVNVGRSITLSFAISGACAALAGAITAYKGGSADPQAFDPQLLEAVTAAVIGGISIRGGRGTVLNIALGVGIFAAISAGMAARGAAEYVTELVTGGLLVAVIAGEWLSARLRQRAILRRHHLDTRATAARA
jgi:ribose/xylose/arabinose/galactoside ABC-type transport system permease subunit